MKIYDITDKLELETKAAVKLGDKELIVKTDSKTAMLYMSKVKNEGISNENIKDVVSMLLTEESAKELDAMELSWKDYSTVAKTIIAVSSGTYSDTEDAGENAQTHTTI